MFNFDSKSFAAVGSVSQIAPRLDLNDKIKAKTALAITWFTHTEVSSRYRWNKHILSLYSSWRMTWKNERGVSSFIFYT